MHVCKRADRRVLTASGHENVNWELCVCVHACVCGWVWVGVLVCLCMYIVCASLCGRDIYLHLRVNHGLSACKRLTKTGLF